ncbi:MAG: DUF5763 domain-containing protein [Ferruginibacter sp.]
MKTILTICVSFLFSSCYYSDRETYYLNERITRLEQRIDSLTGGRNVDPAEPGNYTYSRCQAITKRGTQCKRKAKNNGYCWQHNG